MVLRVGSTVYRVDDIMQYYHNVLPVKQLVLIFFILFRANNCGNISILLWKNSLVFNAFLILLSFLCLYVFFLIILQLLYLVLFC